MKVNPERAAALRQRLSQDGSEAWGPWCERIAGYMPPHAVCSPHYPDRWVWTTPAGVWTLDLGRPQEIAYGGIRVWRGGGDGANSPWQWRFDDPDPEHIRAFLILVGALDWDVPDA